MKSTALLGIVLVLSVPVGTEAAAQDLAPPVEEEVGSEPPPPPVESDGDQPPVEQDPEADAPEERAQEDQSSPASAPQPPILEEDADPEAATALDDTPEQNQPPEQDPEADAPEEPTSPDVAPAENPEEDTEEGEPAPPGYDVCDVSSPEDEATLDRVRREMFETVCNSAQWFDGFFGSRRFDEEARRTNGRAQVRLVWDELDELDADVRFRIRVDLPNLDERVNAFLGRDDEEDFVSGVDDTGDFLPDFFRGEGRQEWIVGLGYRPVSSDRSQTDFDVGVEVRTPLEPFVRGRYRHYWLVGDKNLLRAQESLYWTSQRGFGSTTHLDIERPVGDQFLARWGSRATIDEESEGVEWFTGLTLFHGFGPDQAVSLSLGADGETDDEVTLHEYGSRVTYRRRMLREWFFGELIGGVSWPREIGRERETSWHFGFGFEIQFSGEDLGVGRP